MIVQKQTFLYLWSARHVQSADFNLQLRGSNIMHYQQDSSRTQSRNGLGVKFVKTVISVCFVQVIVTRSWGKTHKHAQIRKIWRHISNFLSSLLSGVRLTSGKVDMLEVKRNPGHFCKQKDRAAGLGEQVEIKFHRVCRLQKLELGSLWDFHSSPTAPDPCLPKNSAFQLWGSAAFKQWQQFKDNRPSGLSRLTFDPSQTQHFVNKAGIITGLFCSHLRLRGHFIMRLQQEAGRMIKFPAVQNVWIVLFSNYLLWWMPWFHIVLIE